MWGEILGGGRMKWPAAVFCTLFAALIQAQTAYPVKPIRLVVPFPPAGATDILSRDVMQRLSVRLGQQIIVDNRPGAAGAIGSELVARSAPDGYTLLMATTSTHSIEPLLTPGLPYDTVKDFAPVSLIATSANLLVVPVTLPANSAKELIALAKASPGTLNFGSSGTGSIVHLTGEMFRSRAGIDIVHVPYKGTQLAVPDLIGGRISLMFDNIVSAMPNLKTGKLKAIGITGLQRSPLLPEVPTIAESGVPGFEASAWFGVYAPAGTPKDIVAKLSRELAVVLHSAEMKQRMAVLGAEPVGSTPEDMAKIVAAETAKWARVIRDANIKID
jgi:tripartite-type tricarboxylate transporter receptor subunit TctC